MVVASTTWMEEVALHLVGAEVSGGGGLFLESEKIKLNILRTYLHVYTHT